jgi:hypothetical protein
LERLFELGDVGALALRFLGVIFAGETVKFFLSLLDPKEPIVRRF